jgi:hypothetical protein
VIRYTCSDNGTCCRGISGMYTHWHRDVDLLAGEVFHEPARVSKFELGDLFQS